VDIFHTAAAPKIVFVLGLTNILSGLLVFFTCRCVPGWNPARSLMQHAWYQRIFKWHCVVWWVFWVSVMVHAVFAIGYYGKPF
jgi:hypothetical protein